ALKLTIAQYLTPGDVSIQEVGIVPDIELVPARILKDRIDLFAPPKTFREADYDKHFFNGFARDEEQAKAGRDRVQQKPIETLRFVKEETAKERKNRELIEAGQAQARVAAEIRVPRTQAGSSMEMSVTAHNTGTVPLSRLRAFTKSDNGVLDRREFVFGQLQPGEKRTWTVPVKIPRYMPSRRDDVTLRWEDEAGDQLEEARAETDIAELPRPTFAWSYQIVGNDGLLHKGETAEIIVDVKNIGT